MGELVLMGHFMALRGTFVTRENKYIVKIRIEGQLTNGFVSGVDSSIYQRRLDIICQELEGVWLDEYIGRATDETVAVYFMSKLCDDVYKVQVISNESEVVISREELGKEGPNRYIQQQIGIRYLLKGELKLADKTFSDLIKSYPDDVQALNLRGRVRRYLGNQELAESDFRMAIKFEDGWFELWRNLANTLLVEEKYDEMKLAFEETLRLAPSNPVVLNNYGYALYSCGEHEKALGYCQEAIKLDSAYYEAYLDTAAIYKALGETETYEYWIKESEKHFTEYPKYSIGISTRKKTVSDYSHMQ